MSSILFLEVGVPSYLEEVGGGKQKCAPQLFHTNMTSILCSCGGSKETTPAFDVTSLQLPRKSVVRNSQFPAS